MGLRPYIWLICKASARHPAVLDERPPEVRRAEARSRAQPVVALADGLVVRDLDVAVDGATVAVRSYRPTTSAALPLHVMAHGGSYWSGSINQIDPLARRYARTAHCVVLSVDYRLAPEHKWPCAAEDFYGVLTWAVEHADELHIDPDRVSVGGVSSGANLAAVATLMARDRGGPSIIFQLLEIPGLDMTASQPSMTSLATGYIVTTAQLVQGYDHYMPEGAARNHPYASPLLADELGGLPPATILVCEFDPMRDEGLAYARRLRADGVAVEVIVAKGHVHSSTYSTSRFIPSARGYQRKTADALRRALNPTPYPRA